MAVATVGHIRASGPYFPDHPKDPKNEATQNEALDPKPSTPNPLDDYGGPFFRDPFGGLGSPSVPKVDKMMVFITISVITAVLVMAILFPKPRKPKPGGSQ